MMDIGKEKGIGRDRWMEMRKIVEMKGKKEEEEEMIEKDYLKYE